MKQSVKEIPTYKVEHIACKGIVSKGFEIFRLEDFVSQMQIFKDAHRHDFYMLMLVTEGRTSQEVDFSSYELSAGTQLGMHPGQIHAWVSAEDLKGYIVFFSEDFFSLRYHDQILHQFSFFHSALESHVFNLSPEAMALTTPLYERLISEFENRDGMFREPALRSYLNVLMIQLARFYDKKPKESSISAQQQLIIDFERLIRKHFKTQRQVKDYADILCITPNYLNSVCSKVTGKSAGELIRQRVMIEAKRLLIHTDNNVSEIAYTLNFDDNSYFCRFFKKYAGKSPEAFRQTQKQSK
ncbi:MAG: helix-turn-helix domain-containing protein [Bernardetiaceae bacterium]|nr:helix-turn-helix domain-containing protein [Bernardetiaceae bacterium]